MASYVVTAPLVSAITEAGGVINLHAGDVVPEEITKASLDHLEGLGFVTKPAVVKSASRKSD